MPAGGRGQGKTTTPPPPQDAPGDLLDLGMVAKVQVRASDFLPGAARGVGVEISGEVPEGEIRFVDDSGSVLLRLVYTDEKVQVNPSAS